MEGSRAADPRVASRLTNREPVEPPVRAATGAAGPAL